MTSGAVLLGSRVLFFRPMILTYAFGWLWCDALVGFRFGMGSSLWWWLTRTIVFAYVLAERRVLGWFLFFYFFGLHELFCALPRGAQRVVVDFCNS